MPDCEMQTQLAMVAPVKETDISLVNTANTGMIFFA